jgi:ectoine hydroxylase-related dioxygenase (phytanoyl-CoA dioxygenase family)
MVLSGNAACPAAARESAVVDRQRRNGYLWMEKRMKKELLKYISGLCRAASAALLAAAMIMPTVTVQALWGAAATAIVGAGFVVLREKGK